MSGKRHVWVAAIIYLIIMAFFWFKSGATVAVKLVDSIPVTLGFLAPALFIVRGITEFKARIGVVVAVVLAALLVYDVLLSFVLATHNPFDLWFAFYPFGSVLLLSLLFAHATLSKPAEG
jgi:hypothetical protein